MKPLCFVLMPFGRKSDATGRLIEFDDVYCKMIAPAVERAGLEVIRADEEEVGTIHKPMFERLVFCEYAIADLTTANPNVFYELGIRHAAKPRSTLALFAEGTLLPFDVNMLRGTLYKLDQDGSLIDPDADSARLAIRLHALRREQSDDSPVFQLLDHMPRLEIDQEKADVFRSRAEYSRTYKERLAKARKQGLAAVRAIGSSPDLNEMVDVEAGIVIDLYLSYRDLEAYDDMLALYERMTVPLQRARLVREQRAFALNRLMRTDEAEKALKSIIDDYGPSSETSGLLGRIYKDRWEEARRGGSFFRSRGEWKLALEAYLAGFEADWRDAYPGVNALTLMEVGDERDPRQLQILPVVLYAASRRARSPSATYWDHATLVEAAVLARDSGAALAAISDALPKLEAGWMAETTARNLRLIREKRRDVGENVDYIHEIESALEEAAMSCKRER